MTYDPNTHHGYADQTAFWEIPISDIPALTGIEEPTKVAKTGEIRRFAHLVYQVNSVPISGDVNVDLSTLETINSEGFAILSAQLDNLSGQITELSGTTLEGVATGTHVDAFSRLRVSSPYTLFESKQLHDKLPTTWDEVLSGSATSVHVSADAKTSMTVTALSSDFVIRQTKSFFNYQAGKSQLCLVTASAMGNQTGVTKRLGLFSDDGTNNNLTPKNGIFFSSNGTDFSWNIAKNSVIEQTVNRTNWDDPMNGTGASGINLDFNKVQIFFIDFSWLGVGSVRVGFIIDEIMHTAHIFRHSNISTSVYMSTPNLPFRYDIQSDGTGGGVMDTICSSIMSEGGQEKTGLIKSISRGANVFQTQNDTDIYPLITIRLQEGKEDISVTPTDVSVILTSNADFRWALVLNPTIAGTDAASFTPINNSAVEYDISRDNTNKLTGGEEIATGYVDKGQKTEIQSTINDEIFKLGKFIDGTRDELVLAVQPVVGSNENFYGSIGWRERL
jgi:hypothetical protein